MHHGDALLAEKPVGEDGKRHGIDTAADGDGGRSERRENGFQGGLHQSSSSPFRTAVSCDVAQPIAGRTSSYIGEIVGFDLGGAACGSFDDL